MSLSQPPLRQGLALGRREHLVVLLTFTSGSVDAIGFVALGGAFTSVMTGNLVLTGIGAAHGDWSLLGRAAAAIVAYILGCAIGARVAGPATTVNAYWPAAVTRALSVEFALLLVFAGGWWLNSGHPNAAALALLTVNAAALGVQSAAIQRFGVPGLSTTYLTGTLTTLVVRLANRQPHADLRLYGQLLVALIGGAAAGTFLALDAPWWTPALPLLCLLTVVVAGRRLIAPEP